tara:strand:- start:127 stop:339 length:213 start_codon:yes stop_codon:yes gene_type:complete
MNWDNEEIVRDFTMRGDRDNPDELDVYDDRVRTERSHIRVNLDDLKKKKKLSRHEEFELKIIEGILAHDQ